MRKCCACGKRFNLLAKNRYEVVIKPAGLECLTKRTTYYSAFDCPRCGCQNIVGIVEKEQGDTGAIEKIRAEIEQNAYPIVYGVNNHEKGMTLYGILQIIDKYKAETE